MTPCLEHKHLLDGRVQTYSCTLIHFEPGFGILEYLIDREYVVHGHRLSPGDVTHALYWEDRPYTLYIWKLKNGEVLHYFNIADRISLSPAEFDWRDLAIDMLIDQRGPHVLDAHELPLDLNPDLRRYIQASQEQVLARYQRIIEEASALLRLHV